MISKKLSSVSFIGTILITTTIAMWLTYTIVTFIRPKTQFFITITILLAFIICLTLVKGGIFKKTILFILVIILIIFILSSFVPSVLIGIHLQNNTSEQLNIFTIDLSTAKTTCTTALPKDKAWVVLCSGESREQFEEDIFIILFANYQGNIYHQQKFKVKDIKIGETVYIEETKK